jgi:hypothetical protein
LRAIACYRLYAPNCLEIARELTPERKLALLRVAQAWLDLADQIVKNGETTLVYETPIPGEEAHQQQPQQARPDGDFT